MAVLAALEVFATRNRNGKAGGDVVASIDTLREELWAAVKTLQSEIAASNQGLREEIARRPGGVA